MRAEHTNLLAVLDCGGDPQATLALAAALRFHGCVGGFLGEGRRRLDRVLAAAPEPTPARTGALLAAAWVALLQGDRSAADQRLGEADELGEPEPVVRAHPEPPRHAGAVPGADGGGHVPVRGRGWPPTRRWARDPKPFSRCSS
ncbi:hypothetical protein [Streptomyces sp. NBC_01352]|uniref:hypothetical protein n=1 Tax=Streptomyces sp. NBC_01352 TaxID=2903834 RepID=UPI002E3327AC|nr:hypothetical protein [Streptomyces sp. NBC_01352]